MLESGGKIEKLLKAIAVHYGALSMKKVMSPPDRIGTSGYMVDREKEKHKTKHSNRESKHTTQQTKQSFQTGA